MLWHRLTLQRGGGESKAAFETLAPKPHGCRGTNSRGASPPGKPYPLPLAGLQNVHHFTDHKKQDPLTARLFGTDRARGVYVDVSRGHGQGDTSIQNLKHEETLLKTLYSSSRLPDCHAKVHRKDIYSAYPALGFFWWAAFHFFANETHVLPTPICNCPCIL